mmetsp:Transcript_9497/g.10431  ORF Transcript_9497/g.10431 Transcript_9497/m.10431 type:complete len:91 (+) Transcript_9497:649-921(+)
MYRFEEAASHFRKAINLDQSNMAATIALGLCFCTLHEKVEAKKLFKEALDFCKTSTERDNEAVYFYIHGGTTSAMKASVLNLKVPLNYSA